MDPGINKPFDRIAKDFADEAPGVFLRLLKIVPPGSTLVPFRAETSPPALLPDYVGLLSMPKRRKVIFHVEFFARYHSRIPRQIARYGGSLAWQHKRPVRSVLLLLREEGVPREVPAFGEYAIGGTVLRHPFETVRLWELDPGPVLESGDPMLLPWALLMRIKPEVVARLGLRIGASGNEQAIVRFLTLGSLRYDRRRLKQMMGGARMGLVEAIMEGSSLVRDEKRKAAAIGRAEGEARGEARGQAKGEAQGKAQGKAEEARHLLRLALAERFPGLENSPEIDQIQDIARLESLLIRHAFREPDRASMERALAGN